MMQIPLIWIYFAVGAAAGAFVAAVAAWFVLASRKEAWERETEELRAAALERENALAASLREIEGRYGELEERFGELARERAVLAERAARVAPLERKAEEHERSIASLREEKAALQKSLEELGVRLRESLRQAERRHEELEASAERLIGERDARIEKLEQERGALERRIEAKNGEIRALEKELSELSTRLEEEREQMRLRIEELKETKETMQKEFRALAAHIMEENSQRFGKVSKERVEEVLKPLREQVKEFRKRIEEVHTEETKELTTLMSEIRHLKELNLKISEDAVNLTRALRGESKKQGIWGEMVLERVLQASGLREGEEYEREVSLQDNESRRYRPDVVVHLPDDRDIIIDAKTSLVAYERYVNAESEEERKLYARHHLEAVKNHIDRLADKSYTRLEGVNTLDFIFMFMPIEGALMLALESDPKLYDRAFAKHIVLVSPTTLLVALRAVENTWKHDRQNKNALLIAQKAGDLYDKFVGFAEDLERIGKQLDTVQKSYDGAWKKLTEGRGNIVRRVQELKELGAKAGKQMPKKIAEEAELDQLPDSSNASST